ncbi:MAG: ArsA-related P-loop ATPase [Actinomycetota bacterium]
MTAEAPITVCLGSGGVGKTTLAAAWAIARAQRGERVVVLAIDPARRLATTLGLDDTDAHADGGNESERENDQSEPGEDPQPTPALGTAALGNDPQLVPGPWPGELWAAMLDPRNTLETLLRRHADPDQFERLVANPLFATVTNSLSGTNEYMAAEKLHELHGDPRFDHVVVDTPPSRHAIDFLDSPERLMRFVDNRLYRTVLAPKGLLRPLTNAAQLVFGRAARLVGAELVNDVIRLFRDLGTLDDGFRQRAGETAELLAGPACRYALITSPRAEPMRESRWIAERLAERSRPLDVVIVNRLTPFGRAETVDPLEDADRARGADPAVAAALRANWEELTALAERENRLVSDIMRDLPAGIEPILLSERTEPLGALADLIELAAAISEPAEA